MNIGIDIRTLMSATRTGVGEYTHHLLSALFEHYRDHEYHLFYNAYKQYAGILPEWNYAHVHRHEFRVPNKVLNTSLAFLKRPHLDTLLDKKVDVFLSPNLHFTALSKNVRSVLTIHDLSFELFPECFSQKQRLWHRLVKPREQCERADHIFVPSESTKHDLLDHYGIEEEKMSVTYLGLSKYFLEAAVLDSDSVQKKKEAVKTKYHLPEQFILYLGTIEPRKNIDGLLDGIALWRKQHPTLAKNYRLVVAGGAGWKCAKELKRMANDPTVQYVGYVDVEDKPFLYQLADVFVFPSLYEGFGLPVLEAMASGTPVVTSNRSALPEVAGTAAYYINPYNVASIAEGVDMVLGDTRVSDILREKGLKQAKKFDWKNTAQSTEQAIKQLK